MLWDYRVESANCMGKSKQWRTSKLSEGIYIVTAQLLESQLMRKHIKILKAALGLTFFFSLS